MRPWALLRSASARIIIAQPALALRRPSSCASTSRRIGTTRSRGPLPACDAARILSSAGLCGKYVTKKWESSTESGSERDESPTGRDVLPPCHGCAASVPARNLPSVGSGKRLEIFASVDFFAAGPWFAGRCPRPHAGFIERLNRLYLMATDTCTVRAYEDRAPRGRGPRERIGGAWAGHLGGHPRRSPDRARSSENEGDDVGFRPIA